MWCAAKIVTSCKKKFEIGMNHDPLSYTAELQHISISKRTDDSEDRGQRDCFGAGRIKPTVCFLCLKLI